MDTSGLVYLAESYSWLRPDWKAVECLERGTFVIGMLVAQLIAPATTQLLVGAMILVFFQVRGLIERPLWIYCGLVDLLIARVLSLCTRALPRTTKMTTLVEHGSIGKKFAPSSFPQPSPLRDHSTTAISREKSIRGTSERNRDVPRTLMRFARCRMICAEKAQILRLCRDCGGRGRSWESEHRRMGDAYKRNDVVG